MTAAMQVANVPAGRKVRAIKTCPWWCGQDDDHLEFGDASHYSETKPIANGQIEAWVDTTDDGVTAEIRLSVTKEATGGVVALSSADAQTVVEDLQQLVDISCGGTPDVHPTTRQDAIDAAGALQSRIDATVLALRSLANDPVDDGPKLWLSITQVLTVLEGIAPPGAIVHAGALSTWSELTREVEQLRQGVGSLTLDEAADGDHPLLVKLMGVENQRRAITQADVLQPDVRR